jgi:hypothetical protein
MRGYHFKEARQWVRETVTDPQEQLFCTDYIATIRKGINAVRPNPARYQIDQTRATELFMSFFLVMRGLDREEEVE